MGAAEKEQKRWGTGEERNVGTSARGRAVYDQQNLNWQGALEEEQDYERHSAVQYSVSGQAHVKRRTRGVTQRRSAWCVATKGNMKARAGVQMRTASMRADDQRRTISRRAGACAEDDYEPNRHEKVMAKDKVYGP